MSCARRRGCWCSPTCVDKPIGCGALKFHNDQPAEVKRMWVAESARGLGVGRRILTELEEHAAASRVRTLRLETNKTLVEAVSLYRSAGYVEVAAFNDEPYAHHWFEKQLVELVAGDLATHRYSAAFTRSAQPPPVCRDRGEAAALVWANPRRS